MMNSMSEVVKRPYRSPLRQEAAQRTRVAIRDAATALFVEQGYVATTMKQIAEAAGVSPRTVFTAFPRGKAEVFHEALNVAVGGDDAAVAVADRPEFRSALTDAETLLDRIVDNAVQLLERAGRLIMVTVESSGADPHMHRLAEQGARATAANMRTVAEALHQHGLLRDDLPVQQAADVLLALASPHVHALFRRNRGWSAGQYRDWLKQTLASTLTKRPGPSPTASALVDG
jgi:AcrR family transcriptional regulator